MRDYERYFDENKRLRELVNTLRDEKDVALSEIKRLKSLYHDRVNELNDEYNLKIAQLENALLETKERSKMGEEKAYEVMMMQERILEKWKAEHRSTVDHYERTVKGVKAENRPSGCSYRQTASSPARNLYTAPASPACSHSQTHASHLTLSL